VERVPRHRGGFPPIPPAPVAFPRGSTSQTTLLSPGDLHTVRIELLRTMLARQNMDFHQQPGKPALVLNRGTTPPLSEVRAVGQFYSKGISVVAGSKFVHLLVDGCDSSVNLLRHAREC